MEKTFLKKSALYICSLLISSTFIIFLPQDYVLAMQYDSSRVETSNLSPRIFSMDFNALAMSYTAALKGNAVPFEWDFTKQIEDEGINQIFNELQYLNSLYLLNNDGRSPEEAVIEYILKDAHMTEVISSIIRAQDRMEETPYGIAIDRAWAETFKNESLKRALHTLEGRDIFFLQMEYELSVQFLVAFKEHLIKHYLMFDDGTPYEERRKRASKLAVYATGQLAKLQMAGGLGSFKPDMVRGFYDDLKKFWGVDKARNKLHVMGVLYAKAIKGEGELVRDKNLDPVVEKIRHVKNIENNTQQRVHGESELVGVALETMKEVVTYNIPVNMNGFANVDVTIYSNPHSELREYWMYCPEIFHEPYPGNADDEFRAVQTFVYREVFIRYIKFLVQSGKIGNKIIISDSETSSSLANPRVIDQNLERYPAEKRKAYSEIFDALSEFDILYHHYNHTIVPAGMGSFPDWKFYDLKIKPELRFIQQEGSLDLRMLVGETHDIITGCSTAHTQIMCDNPELYKYFAYKIREDDLFGNSEGSDVKRWQGREIRMIIEIYMQQLKVETYDALFRALEANPEKKNEFIAEVKVAKKMQKKRFINELFSGTFGKLDVTLQELEKDGVNLLDRPFFTFVRRMVPYKCSDRIVDMLEDEQYRERIIKSGAVIIIGGRKFDDFSQVQHRRIQKLIEQDKRLRAHIIFISNHNVATSWVMQQGTDFGGMLSWEGMEAGPTSPSNAGLNWTNLFSSPDGVMIERLRKIKRDEKGEVIAGTGYIVAYADERADNALNSRLPDKDSFINELEEGCRNYFKGKDYDKVAFNNMWLQMTQGDIRTQAAGLLMVWADYLREREQAVNEINEAIEKFVSSQSYESVRKILRDGDNQVDKFRFKEDWPAKEAEQPGLESFLRALEKNTEQGFIYQETIHFVEYIKTLLKYKSNNKFIFDVFERVNGTLEHYNSATYYDKQREFIYVLDRLVKELIKREQAANTSFGLSVFNKQDLTVSSSVERSI